MSPAPDGMPPGAATDGEPARSTADVATVPTGAPAGVAGVGRRPARRHKRLSREYAEAALLALVIALAVRAVCAETFRIPTASMAPGLLAGDHVLASKLSFGLRLPFTRTWLTRWREVRRGDVVVFDHPTHGGEVHVKRVVGVPGDVVELRGQVLYVNGVAQPRERIGPVEVEERSNATGAWWSEPCTIWREVLARDPAAREDATAHAVAQCREAAPGEREGPFTVEEGHVFVAGDNRDRSDDSRASGARQVPLDHVIGRVVRVLWSWGPDGARGGPGRLFRADRLFKPVE